MFEDAADDPVAAAVYLKTYLCLVFRVGIGECVHICGSILEDDASGGNLVEICMREGFVEDDMIDLFDLMTGMGEFLREIAVVGEQQDTRGVAVETAYREYAFGWSHGGRDRGRSGGPGGLRPS